MTLTEEFKEFLLKHTSGNLTDRERMIRAKHQINERKITDPADIAEIYKLLNIRERIIKCNRNQTNTPNSSNSSSEMT